MMEMDPQFRDVLRSFNLQGYASNAKYEKLSDGTRLLTLKDGIWAYEDRYVLGSDVSLPYAGSTIISREGEPYWMMGYGGKCLLEEFPSQFIYAGLREALSNPDEAFPVRGRHGFRTSSGLTYEWRWRGSLFMFQGEETLVRDGIEQYAGFFHGLQLAA